MVDCDKLVQNDDFVGVGFEVDLGYWQVIAGILLFYIVVDDDFVVEAILGAKDSGVNGVAHFIRFSFLEASASASAFTSACTLL